MTAASLYFNPRSLAGATHQTLHDYFTTYNFNPRSLAGATPNCCKKCNNCKRFQSTLPRGSDHLLSLHRKYRKYFNPRSLAGATGLVRPALLVQLNFNPRSLAGATNILVTLVSFNINFNPRSLAGATNVDVAYTYNRAFQSTLPRGSDFAVPTYFRLYQISIHAPSRERPGIVRR